MKKHTKTTSKLHDSITLPDTGIRKGGGLPRRSSFHFICLWLDLNSIMKVSIKTNRNLLNCKMSWTLPDTGLRKGGGSPRRSSFHFIYPWLEPIWHHVIEKRLDFTHHRQGSCWTLEPRTSVSFRQYIDSFCHTVVQFITIFNIQSTVQLGALTRLL